MCIRDRALAVEALQIFGAIQAPVYGVTRHQAAGPFRVKRNDAVLAVLCLPEMTGHDRQVQGLAVVTCHFREAKDGEHRIISFYAKRARGLMARYAIDRRLDRAEDLKGFDGEG